MTFSMKRFSTNRKFSNLFGEDIDTIKNRVNFFINNRDWYNEKGIPYSLGLLLSGKPGTGKTSTIKCLAHETRRHIFNINLNNDITKQQLENLFLMKWYKWKSGNLIVFLSINAFMCLKTLIVRAIWCVSGLRHLRPL